jgi:Ni/Co efflux regulator RcnB
MKKLLSVLVAVLFTAVSASAFAAAHGGAPMKDGEKKMAKKDGKKAAAKKAPRKSQKKGAGKKAEDKK